MINKRWLDATSKKIYIYENEISDKYMIVNLQDVLIDLILYVPVNNFSIILGRVLLCWIST